LRARQPICSRTATSALPPPMRGAPEPLLTAGQRKLIDHGGRSRDLNGLSLVAFSAANRFPLCRKMLRGARISGVETPVTRSIAVAMILLGCPALGAHAQDKGTLNPQPLPPLAHPNDPATPAKELFGRKVTPASLTARSIGTYNRGCLAGGLALPINGKT